MDLDTFYKIVSAIFIAGVSSLITVSLSLHKFRTEKWWETRVSAYIDLIDSLHSLKDYGDVHLGEATEDRNVGDEEKEKLNVDYMLAFSRVRRAANVGSLLFSASAQKEISSCLKGLNAATETDCWPTHLIDHNDAMYGVIEKIVEISKSDLKLGVNNNLLQRIFNTLRPPKTR